ncbi:MAG: XdhC/CoxI family protein [Syntrophomonadaceae bacterium]|nr:XdhC/CoxI family protein [Syntrophomonadaceae bacterium]
MEANIMRLLAAKQDVGEDAALVTVISANKSRACRPGAMLLLDQFGEMIDNTIEDGLLRDNALKQARICLNQGFSRRVQLEADDGTAEVFINVFSHGDRLIIVGSGNVALNIYRIAVILGYRISVIDNRAETLTRERFPEARELLLGDIVDILGKLEINETTSIVLVTHHHEFDEVALHAIIRSSARYIGILGNKYKVTAYFSKLDEVGIPQILLDRLHIPIGLDLGGQKAAEIALAAVAEMQAVKYGRSGGFVVLQHDAKGIIERDELF